MFSGVLSTFASLALLLAAVGIYGVLSYAVSRRVHEIGVRLALGANAGEVVRLVLRRPMMSTAVGLGIGMVGALAATRVLSSLLFEVSATDPLTFGSVVLILTMVALMAGYLPARRASRVDPVVALRHE
jgi:putative ABC transport system permease protein